MSPLQLALSSPDDVLATSARMDAACRSSPALFMPEKPSSRSRLKVEISVTTCEHDGIELLRNGDCSTRFPAVAAIFFSPSFSNSIPTSLSNCAKGSWG